MSNSINSHNGSLKYTPPPPPPLPPASPFLPQPSQSISIPHLPHPLIQLHSKSRTDLYSTKEPLPRALQAYPKTRRSWPKNQFFDGEVKANKQGHKRRSVERTTTRLFPCPPPSHHQSEGEKKKRDQSPKAANSASFASNIWRIFSRSCCSCARRASFSAGGAEWRSPSW